MVLNFPIIEHQSPDLFHTFTVHFALAPVVLHPWQNVAGNFLLLSLKSVIFEVRILFFILLTQVGLTIK